MLTGIERAALKSMLMASLVIALSARGQNIGRVSGDAITSESAPRIGASHLQPAGSIARAPGGESTGVLGYGYSEVRAAAVSGKVAGYGMRISRTSMGEIVGASRSSNAPGASSNGDFVASMPKPVLAPTLSSATGTSSGFGLTAPTASGSNSHRAAARPKRKLNTDAVRDPFTHQIGLPGAPGLPGSTKPLVGLGSLQP